MFGISPAAQLVKQTYSFLPFRPFFLLLGLWEMAIGCGMITRLGLRLALVLLWLHLAGTFGALYLAPKLFFLGGNLACLSMEGAFVVKNLVLIAAGLVVAGYQLKVPPAVLDRNRRTAEKPTLGLGTPSNYHGG